MMRILILLVLAATAIAHADDDRLLTVAERSGFKATARHADVVALLDRIADASPLVTRTSLGHSGQGREIPALIISDPPIATPDEAKKQIREEGKLLVMAIGNIHGGEVCGKEALCMLARELTTTPKHPLLEHLIIILAPIYNTDGNERFSKNNRPGQIGPADGMGQRTNAAGLDLNRDFVKLEAPETRALVKFVSRWDPSIFIDTHTTDGSYHRYLVTYEGPKTVAGDQRLVEFTRDEMFPAITRITGERYHVLTYFYGNLNREHTRWTTYEATARFGTSYIGLRNRISILSEAYSYEPYKRRVLGTRDFVKACLEYAAENRKHIRALLSQLDRTTATADPSTDDQVAIRGQIAPAPEKVKVAGFVERPREDADAPRRYGPRSVSTGEPKDYEVELWNRFKPTLSVRRPLGYVIPPGHENVIEKLVEHGIEVGGLVQPSNLDVEIYEIDKVEFAKREFQKHHVATVEATPKRQMRRYPAGTVIVETAQPLGNLVVYLLEPECEDGLTAWNYFDDDLKPGAEFPIARVMTRNVNTPRKP